ncbi:MAG: ribose-phosphate diphosphokinase, partial [Oscillospiraceae bacterium]|nr:ribose-phosphate diphosphokinase [Oscillospiraceae bacterium]
AKELGCAMAIVDKRRHKTNESEVMNIIGDVRGKKVILFDDVVDTAGTLCNAAQALVESGGAKEVMACATHGVLSGPALGRLSESVISRLILLDTIEQPPEKSHEKIQVLKTSENFATAIRRVYEDIPFNDIYSV